MEVRLPQNAFFEIYTVRKYIVNYGCEWPVTLFGWKIYGKNIYEESESKYSFFQHVYHTLATLH